MYLYIPHPFFLIHRDLSDQGPEAAEQSLQTEGLFSLSERVEMGGMANLFFNKHGRVAFYVTMCLYLFGDLAIYGVAVPRTLVKVIW